MKIQTYVSVVFICLAGMHCVKRPNQPSPDNTKVEMEKSDLIKMVHKDLTTEEQISDEARYRTETLMPGDRISVVIYEKLPVSQDKRTEMKRIDEDGLVFILPIGEIKLEGLTLTQAERKIEKKFSQLVVSPHCEIQIIEKQYSPRVYVYGEVGKSGSVEYRPGDRLLDAISEAGGCAESAYRRSIKVIRVNETRDRVSIYSIDLYEILDKGNIYNNLSLRDQDIVFVPRRFLTGFKEVFSVLNVTMPYWIIFRTFRQN